MFRGRAGHSKTVVGEPPGGHVKNLFLRNKKGLMWLVVTPAEREIDLKRLASLLGTSGLSFASVERLDRHLGVVAGAVTPFAVVNDHDRVVKVVVDRALMTRERLNLHPLENTATSGIAPDALIRFLEMVAHPPEILVID
jgi:Ala-tRNA(Pro) deacylase